jgi:hypothetical protein
MTDFTNGRFFTSGDRVLLDPDPMSGSLPFQPRYWNNTWLQTLQHCPRHFWYSAVRGLKPLGSSVHLTFGTLLHGAADIKVKGAALGLSAEDATDAALDWVLEASWPAGSDKDVFGGQYLMLMQCQDRTKTVAKKGIKRCEWSYREHLYHHDGDLCHGCGGELDTRIGYVCPEKVKNRRSLIRAVLALCDYLDSASIRAMRLEDGRIGSELRWFRELPMPSPDQAPYMMTGSYDGAALEGELNIPVGPEYKTTQREPNEAYFASMIASPQCQTYSWSGTKDFGERFRVLYLVLHIGQNSCEVVTKRVYLAPDQLLEWEADMMGVVQEGELRARAAAQLEQQNLDPSAAYPRRLSACHSLPGATSTPCEFRAYCTTPRCDREAFLGNNFEVAHFNPLGAKGIAKETDE